MPMTHSEAKTLLRLDRIQRQAEIWQEEAVEAGNTARAIRAGRLAMAAHERSNALAMSHVRPYSDT
jgi:hypothetical protein